MARRRNRFYAYKLGDQQGILTSWPACQSIVNGKPARYKGFRTREEAEAWLRAGARYGDWDDGVSSPWLDRVRARINAHSATSRPESVHPLDSPDRDQPNSVAQVVVNSEAVFPDADKVNPHAGSSPLPRPPAAPPIHGPLPEQAVYFDSGTGRGHGTEVNVTDHRGTPLAHLVTPPSRITPFQTVRLSPGRTNNYGELLACLLAIRVARKLGRPIVAGDSRLALDYWSRGLVRRELREADPDLARLAAMTARERVAFEAGGGELRYIRGDRNPADLGFHRK